MTETICTMLSLIFSVAAITITAYQEWHWKKALQDTQPVRLRCVPHISTLLPLTPDGQK